MNAATDQLPEDWWTTEQVATYLDITPSTIRAYLARHQMPPPDRRMGPLSLWRPCTIREWDAGRPSKQTTR